MRRPAQARTPNELAYQVCCSAWCADAQILQVAGETANKAADAAAKPTVPKNFKMPKQINSYADYLKYAGQANGIIPVTPEAESDAAMSPNAAPGPMSEGGTLLRLLHSTLVPSRLMSK